MAEARHGVGTNWLSHRPHWLLEGTSLTLSLACADRSWGLREVLCVSSPARVAPHQCQSVNSVCAKFITGWESPSSL